MAQARHGRRAFFGWRHERHTGQPDAFQPALEHGRWAIKPDGKHKHQMLCPLQRIGMRLHPGFNQGRVAQVGDAFFAGEDRLKVFGIQVKRPQCVAARRECVNGCREQRAAQTVRVGVAVDDKGLHMGWFRVTDGLEAMEGAPAVTHARNTAAQGLFMAGRVGRGWLASAYFTPSFCFTSMPLFLFTNWVVATLPRSTSPALYRPALTILS